MRRVWSGASGALGVLVAGAGIALAASGCGGISVDPGKLAAVQVAGADSSVRGCRLLGPVEARDSNRWVPGGPRYEVAMLELRKKAVMGGGNYLVTDAIEAPRDTDYNPAFVVRARLFACDSGVAPSALPGPLGSPSTAEPAAPAATTPAPPPPAAPPVAPPPVAPATTAVCEPDCSPGYTCLRGTCVSACNPLCSGGERCGADRVCHSVTALPPPAPLPR